MTVVYSSTTNPPPAAQHLGKPGAPATLPPYETEVEREYAEHPWNINNMPRSTGSVLRCGLRQACLLP